jgi:NADP-dependent 3-hydroxy acid dehydrogenase YdfG
MSLSQVMLRLWCKKAVDVFGRIDVMINNAGLMSIAPMSECKIDEWDRMIDINIKGVLYGIAGCSTCV